MRRSVQQGFTLIELLVALAVFSLAAIALLKLQGTTIASASAIDRRLVAGIVAQSLATDALTDVAAPAIGSVTGTERNYGVDWLWRRTTARTADARILRIDIAVIDDGREIAQATVVRTGGAR